MKEIRIIAEFLLILTGIIHLVLFLISPMDKYAQLYLVFGIFYLSIGILMLVKPGFSAAWGIIFPLIGLLGGIFMIVPSQWSALLLGLFVVDVVIIACCSFLYLKTERL